MKSILYCLTFTLPLVGCTTGSKYKYIENHYTNVEGFYSTSDTLPHYDYEEPVIIKQPPVYHYDSRKATMADLGKAMGEKMLRKMRAAYNEN
jgi:oligoendopeptidase F